MNATIGTRTTVEPTDALRVRQAGLADVPAMAGLLRELFLIEPDFACDPEKQVRALRMLLGQTNAAVWVAEWHNGDVVGMVSVQLVVSTAEGGYSGLLEDLVVTEERRNKGIGARLLEAAVNWTRSKGATRLQLLADRRNAPAFRFYFRYNWEPTRMVALRRGL